jgi:hypothetical protein
MHGYTSLQRGKREAAPLKSGYSSVMKKLLIGMVLLGSFVFAEPMPRFTPQYNAAQDVIAAVGGFQFECPVSLLSNPEALDAGLTYEVICSSSDIGIDMMRSTLDLQLTDYEPLTAWQFIEDETDSMFKRMYKLDPGAFIVQLYERDSGGGYITIVYSQRASSTP